MCGLSVISIVSPESSWASIDRREMGPVLAGVHPGAVGFHVVVRTVPVEPQGMNRLRGDSNRPVLEKIPCAAKRRWAQSSYAATYRNRTCALKRRDAQRPMIPSVRHERGRTRSRRRSTGTARRGPHGAPTPAHEAHSATRSRRAGQRGVAQRDGERGGCGLVTAMFSMLMWQISSLGDRIDANGARIDASATIARTADCGPTRKPRSARCGPTCKPRSEACELRSAGCVPRCRQASVRSTRPCSITPTVSPSKPGRAAPHRRHTRVSRQAAMPAAARRWDCQAAIRTGRVTLPNRIAWSAKASATSATPNASTNS